jgi:predicted nucleic acid-binding protein
MGRVVDTSVFAACERKGWNAVQTLEHLSQVAGGPLIVSSIVAAELIEGIFRAQTTQQADTRRSFLLDLFRALPPLPFSQETAWIAGQIRGEQGKIGRTLPLADSLIAATALELDCAVVTHNLRDFQSIPGLRIIAFAKP